MRVLQEAKSARPALQHYTAKTRQRQTGQTTTKAEVSFKSAATAVKTGEMLRKSFDKFVNTYPDIFIEPAKEALRLSIKR